MFSAAVQWNGLGRRAGVLGAQAAGSGKAGDKLKSAKESGAKVARHEEEEGAEGAEDEDDDSEEEGSSSEDEEEEEEEESSEEELDDEVCSFCGTRVGCWGWALVCA